MGAQLQPLGSWLGHQQKQKSSHRPTIIHTVQSLLKNQAAASSIVPELTLALLSGINDVGAHGDATACYFNTFLDCKNPGVLVSTFLFLTIIKPLWSFFLSFVYFASQRGAIKC